MMASILVSAASLFVVVVAAILAVHRDYHTGILGTCGLGLLSLAGVTHALHLVERMMDGVWRTPSPTAVFAWVGLALLMAHLGLKFWRRLGQRGTSGWYDSSLRRN